MSHARRAMNPDASAHSMRVTCMALVHLWTEGEFLPEPPALVRQPACNGRFLTPAFGSGPPRR
jgi:hypothetical protein